MLVWFITTRSTPYKPKHVEIAITTLGEGREEGREGKEGGGGRGDGWKGGGIGTKRDKLVSM